MCKDNPVAPRARALIDRRDLYFPPQIAMCTQLTVYRLIIGGAI